MIALFVVNTDSICYFKVVISTYNTASTCSCSSSKSIFFSKVEVTTPIVKLLAPSYFFSDLFFYFFSLNSRLYLSMSSMQTSRVMSSYLYVSFARYKVL